MDKVLVLLSTYNGEKYLREQLDSIFNQEGVDVSVLARDDGSSDDTIAILEDYATKYNLKIIEGNNINWMHSFWKLVNTASNHDYYAFSDQDDIWDKDKLKKAINMLSLYKNVPAIYCANQRLVNEKLQTIPTHEDKVNINEFKAQDLLVWGNLFRGCTEVWNNKLQEYVLNKRINDIDEPHDAFLMQICLLVGTVMKDNSDVMSYRQHDNNTLGAQGLYKRLLFVFNNITGKAGMYKPFSSRIKKVYSYVKEDVRPEIKKYVIQVCNYDQTFWNTVKLAVSMEYPNMTFKKRIQILLRKF